MKLKQLAVFSVFTLCVANPCFLLAEPAALLGAWTDSSKNSPLVEKGPFDFQLAKSGVFSQAGKTTWRKPYPELKKGTPHVYHWITHRLAKNEKLSKSAATSLAHALDKRFSQEPGAKIELDIEPLPLKTASSHPWIVGFFSQLRLSLTGSAQISVALPAVGATDLSGKLLPHVEGLDFMLYDTGAQTAEAYQENIRGILQWLLQVMPEHSTKQFILGLPSYPDKTKLHRSEIENISAFLSVWSQLLPEQRKGLCMGNISFSVYAGWTLATQDLLLLQALKDEWLKCRK